MNHARILRLISGQETGSGAMLARAGLRLLEVPYSGAIWLRNRTFDWGWRRVDSVAAPVISVGNITTGGTGKTPFVAWLAKWFRQAGSHVAIVSRGYGARDGTPNDEARELAQQLPDVPHLQNPRRVLAAREAIASHRANLILLDDGFQHRRLHRDLDIVLIDALNPFGYDHLLPRGLLREPLPNLRRADVVVLSRADLVPATERQRIQQTVQAHAPRGLWCEVCHAPTELIATSGQTTAIATALSTSSGNNPATLAAFCGIGNPAGFRQTLDNLGWQVRGWREFPDHHDYSTRDLAELSNWVKSLGDCSLVVCTRKDLVKLPHEEIANVPLRALGVGIQFVSGEEALVGRLKNFSASK